MLDFLLAALPITVILVGMAGFDLPSKILAPICWIIAFATSLIFFAAPTFDVSKLFSTSIAGVLDGVRIVWLIFTAFVTLQIMIRSGSMDQIKRGLAGVTLDKRLVVVLLALPFGTFIEGASGAGTPAALAAPFLVALGMNPVVAAGACLIGNSAPVSWGGAGVTTVMGAGQYVDFVEASIMTGRMACFEYVVLPFLMLVFVFGLKSLKGIWKELVVLGVLMGIVNFAISNLLLPVTELTSLLGGFVDTILYCVYLKMRKEDLTSIPQEYRLSSDAGGSKQSLKELCVALSPYVLLCTGLVVVRLSVPLPLLIGFGGGYTVWVGCVILVCAFIAAAYLRQLSSIVSAMWDSFLKVIPALLAMSFLLAMVNCMKMSGQISTLAKTLSAAAGVVYPIAAVLIGQVGGFITGTNLGSNLMFNPLHIEAAKNLGLNAMVLVAAQNTGGAIGNMICPNNVIAVCACVGILGREGEVLRKTLMPSVLLLFFLGALAMAYTYWVFPL
ncbi:MAG: L-lactate permease [Synergistaceae bacterium]|jgi:lactate permease|nr:L-lactate permease [Synergistaceae bacterium]